MSAAPLEFAYPLTVGAGEAEGRALVAELPPECAPALMRALRLVLAWTRGGAAPPAAALEAWEAESADAGLDPALAAPLQVLADALRAGADADGRVLARCALALADWALAAGAEATALHFAEAAALARPADARLAWTAGKLFRGRGRAREAELWLRRAARVAVRARDAEAQNLALNSLANLYAQQGSFSEALRYLKQALTGAQRHHLREREAAVTHDLLAVSILTGNHAQAETWANRALGLYGPRHRCIPRLAHDVAQLWNHQGRFALSLPVLRALAGHFRAPADRLRVLASTVRAAAAEGDRQTYDAAWGEAWQIVDTGGVEVRAVLPSTLTDLGHGATSLGEWEGATAALSRALHAARERGEHDMEMQAEIALELAQSRQRAEPPRRAPQAEAGGRLSAALVADLGHRREPWQPA